MAGDAVRPVFGVVFPERGVVFGVVFGLCSANAVRQTRLVFGLCSACVRPVFGERGSANAVLQTRLVLGNVFGLCSACVRPLFGSVHGPPWLEIQISAPDFTICCSV